MKSNSTKQIPYFNYKVKYTPVFNTSIETTADPNQSAQSDIVINTAIDHQARSYFSPRTSKGGGALCAGNAVALLVFGPVMP